ncbi:MAG: hypothetical protein QM564_13370 [Bergeyella sp.]
MKDYKNIMNSKNIYEINAFLRDAHPDDPRRSILKPRVMEMIKDYINKAHPADQRIKEMQEMLATLKRKPSTKISFDEMNEIIRQKQIAYYKAEMEKANRSIAAGKGSQANQSAAAGQTAGGNIGKIAPANTGMAAGYANPEADEFQMLMNVSPIEHKQKTAKILTSLFDNDPMSKECIVMVRNDSDCDIIMRMEGTGTNNFRLAIPAKKENSIVIPKGDYLFTSLVCGAQYASQKTIQKALMVALNNPGAK